MYEQQLSAVVHVLNTQQTGLQTRVTEATREIENFNTAGANRSLDDLVSERSGLSSQIQRSRARSRPTDRDTAVSDPGKPDHRPRTAIRCHEADDRVEHGVGSRRRPRARSGRIILFAVGADAVRRRSDIAAALRAPVVVSVGPIVPARWRRFLLPPADPSTR